MKIFFFAVLLAAACTRTPTARDDEKLAECLTDKGVTLYGAKWCGACKEQEELFGPAFGKIKHVACDHPGRPGTDPGCSDADGHWCYPTWSFPSGKRICGVQTLPELAKEAGCPYP